MSEENILSNFSYQSIQANATDWLSPELKSPPGRKLSIRLWVRALSWSPRPSKNEWAFGDLSFLHLWWTGAALVFGTLESSPIPLHLVICPALWPDQSHHPIPLATEIAPRGRHMIPAEPIRALPWDWYTETRKTTVVQDGGARALD